MRERGALVAVAVVTFLAGACGDPDNVYVSEPASGLFLKLPNDWGVFDLAAGRPAADPRTELRFGAWTVIIDGAPHPSRSHLDEPEPDHPVGVVSVTPLLGNDELAATVLAPAGQRSLLVQGLGDPVTDELEGVEVLDAEDLDFDGSWGTRLTVTLEEEPGGPSVTITQIALVDDGATRFHFLRLLCSVDCYEDNEDEIEAILGSLILEPR